MVIAGLPGHAVTFIHRAEAWCCFSSLFKELGGVLGVVVVRCRRTDVGLGESSGLIDPLVQRLDRNRRGRAVTSVGAREGDADEQIRRLHYRAVAHRGTVQVAAEVMTIALMSKRRHSRKFATCSERCERTTRAAQGSRRTHFRAAVADRRHQFLAM